MLVQRDRNDVDHSGVLVDQPRLQVLKNNREILIFTLKVTEYFTLANNIPGSHENFFTYEVLGRNARAYLNELRVGHRYIVSGYLRADNINGETKVRVRCYNVQPEMVDDGR